MTEEAKTPADILEDLKWGLEHQGKLEEQLRAARAANEERIQKLATVFPLGTHRQFQMGPSYQPAHCLITHDAIHGLQFVFRPFERLADLKWPEPSDVIEVEFDEKAPSETLRLPHEPAASNNLLDDEVA